MLISEEGKYATLYITLTMFLNMQMKIAKQEGYWDYSLLRETNQSIRQGLITCDHGMRVINSWAKENANDTSFDYIKFVLMARKYGIKLG